MPEKNNIFTKTKKVNELTAICSKVQVRENKHRVDCNFLAHSAFCLAPLVWRLSLSPCFVPSILQACPYSQILRQFWLDQNQDSANLRTPSFSQIYRRWGNGRGRGLHGHLRITVLYTSIILETNKKQRITALLLNIIIGILKKRLNLWSEEPSVPVLNLLASSIIFC